MVCFTKLTPRTPPSVIHGWKATDLLFQMVKRKNYCRNPISRQNFANALAENPNLKLEMCHMVIIICYLYLQVLRGPFDFSKGLSPDHKLEGHIYNIITQQGQSDTAEGATSKSSQKNWKASDVIELSKCPICQEDCFTDPVVTECGHLICWPCLARNRSSAEHNRNNCPMCRQTYGSVMSINMKGKALSVHVLKIFFF